MYNDFRLLSRYCLKLRISNFEDHLVQRQKRHSEATIVKPTVVGINND